MSNFYRPRRRPPNDGDFDIPDIDIQQEMQNLRRYLPFLVLAALAVLLFFFLQALPTLFTNWLWFKSLGQGSVFTTRIVARLGLFLASALIFFVLYMINILIARRLSPTGAATSRPLLLLAIAAGLFLSVMVGTIVQAQWEMILRYLNASSFALSDPVFHKDVSFYVFNLPVYSLVQELLSISVVVIAAAVAAVYALALGRFRLTPGVKAHLSGLGAIFLLLYAWNYQISIYNLVYSTRGVVYGASYTDVNAQWPAYSILTIITLIAAAILIVNIFLRATKALAATAALWIIATILLGQLYPDAVQNFQVKPNESVKEQPYIQYNITLTRRAFNLDTIDEQSFPGTGSPTAADLAANEDTVSNIRLWDYRPLLATYEQLQSIRPYYTFNDIDIDRYMIGGKERQVMLSAREMAQSGLPPQAQTWINQKLVYTHGYGVAMSPVNAIQPDGSPDFFIKDIPPVGEIKIDQPGLYFGERMSNYIIVDTNIQEFDYPQVDQYTVTTYKGADGVSVGSFFNRLLFSLRFGDVNFLLTDAINGESKVLMYRNIQDRIRMLAPFLQLDRDPYIVLADGKQYWIQDAYTITDRYPFSEPYANGANYIRNSVKVTIDAYNGTITFYVADPDDPLIKAWQGIFPSLFTPISDMPAGLRAHVRYPEDIFTIQSQMLLTYHMLDPRSFYNKEDQWAMPQEVLAEQSQPMDPYYTVMRLPGGTSEEFILLLPFTPNNKQNMLAWLGARSDGEDYGKLSLYQMPRDYLVYGPLQVDARISQDTTVSAQLTLWNQKGSTVTRGNLMIIPIGKSFLYVKPIYLLADQTQIPQLKRVIVVTADGVAMDNNLNLALAQLYGTGQGTAAGTQTPTQAPQGTQTTAPVSSDIASLIQQANQQYKQAQDALKAGDWAKYGDSLNALEDTLNQLAVLSGGSQ
jgi:uncharacterized membrane protein (UPF0182 family)